MNVLGEAQLHGLIEGLRIHADGLGLRVDLTPMHAGILIFRLDLLQLITALLLMRGKVPYLSAVILCGFFLPLDKEVLQSRNVRNIIALLFCCSLFTVARKLFLKLLQLLFVAFYAFNRIFEGVDVPIQVVLPILSRPAAFCGELSGIYPLDFKCRRTLLTLLLVAFQGASGLLDARFGVLDAEV